MYANQERCGDKEVAARPQHVQYIPCRPSRPEQVLEHLIGNNQVESSWQSVGTDVEIRIAGFGVAPEWNRSKEVSGGNFKDLESFRNESLDQPKTLPIHDGPRPVTVVVPDTLQK